MFREEGFLCRDPSIRDEDQSGSFVCSAGISNMRGCESDVPWARCELKSRSVAKAEAVGATLVAKQ